MCLTRKNKITMYVYSISTSACSVEVVCTECPIDGDTSHYLVVHPSPIDGDTSHYLVVHPSQVESKKSTINSVNKCFCVGDNSETSSK